MHFAIDEDPVETQPKRADAAVPPAPPEQPKVPAAMLMESTPVKVVGSPKNRQKVAIILEDIYQRDGRVYVRYAIENAGSRIYLPATPAVFALKSPHSAQSLVGLANSQLAGDVQLRWKDEARRAWRDAGSRGQAGSNRSRHRCFRATAECRQWPTDGGDAQISGGRSEQR